MNAKRFVTATVVGGVTYLILGYVLYVLLFAGFFEANAGPGADAYRPEPLLGYLFGGELLMAALLTWILSSSGVHSFADGAKAGAIFGLLLGAAISLGLYGLTTLYNLTAALVDPILAVVRSAIVGGVIAVVLGRNPNP